MSTQKVTLRVYRGDAESGELQDYSVEVSEGMVVLDAVHQIQATQAPDLACRWNCKAGKCGSCSAEINGKPRLMCMTRMVDAIKTADGGPILVKPMKTFPHIKDLVTDVSQNYRNNKKITPFRPAPKGPDGEWKIFQYEIDRAQEFRKCIECYLCQDVCHVLRDHHEFTFAGPRYMVRAAGLEMHPADQGDRIEQLKEDLGIGYCNITKCCSEVCPEGIHITDNAIIPLKERVVDEHYDPITALFRRVFGKKAPPNPAP